MLTALLATLVISLLLTYVGVTERNIWKKHYWEIPTSGHRRRYLKWQNRCIWLATLSVVLLVLTMVAILFAYAPSSHYPLPL